MHAVNSINLIRLFLPFFLRTFRLIPYAAQECVMLTVSSTGNMQHKCHNSFPLYTDGHQYFYCRSDCMRLKDFFLRYLLNGD